MTSKISINKNEKEIFHNVINRGRYGVPIIYSAKMASSLVSISFLKNMQKNINSKLGTSCARGYSCN